MSDRRDRFLAAASHAAARVGVAPIAARIRARVDARGGPAVAVIGRRGAGKSSVLNALDDTLRATVGHVRDETAAVSAHPLAFGGGFVCLDAPGLRGARGGWSEVRRALVDWSPALTLFVVGATEVDTSADDVALLADLLGALPRQRRGCVAVVNRVDEVDPVDDSAPPFRHPRKGFHIAEACARARRALARGGVEALDVIAMSALVVRRGGVIEYDGRWNVDALRAALVAQLASTPRVWGLDALATDVGALAARYAASGSDPRDVREGCLGALLGRPPRAASRGARWLLGDEEARARSLWALARSAPDLSWLVSAPRAVTAVDDDGAGAG